MPLPLEKRGAEALIQEVDYLGRKAVLKERVKKAYRHEGLDWKLRQERTRLEASLLHKAKEKKVRVPVIWKVDKRKASMLMECIEGERLKEALQGKEGEAGLKEKYCRQAGSMIKRLHDGGIIHGDLTTSNFLIQAGKESLVLVDFGLGYYSSKAEDKAVDLVNFKKTFQATHYNCMKAWEALMRTYASKEVERHMREVEQRIRYA